MVPIAVAQEVTSRDPPESGDTMSAPTVIAQEEDPITSERSTMTTESSPHTTTRDNGDDILQLNIGGTHMDVYRSTLTCIPGAPLASLLESSERSANGRIFVDEDPELFAIFLRYLRSRRRASSTDETFPFEIVGNLFPQSSVCRHLVPSCYRDFGGSRAKFVAFVQLTIAYGLSSYVFPPILGGSRYPRHRAQSQAYY